MESFTLGGERSLGLERNFTAGRYVLRDFSSWLTNNQQSNKAAKVPPCCFLFR